MYILVDNFFRHENLWKIAKKNMNKISSAHFTLGDLTFILIKSDKVV